MTILWRSIAGASLGLAPTAPAASVATSPPLRIEIDTRAPTHPFPHFWEEMFGSGRANLALREGYRQDLALIHERIGLNYIRFHAIFHDENGVYDEDEKGQPLFNFSYVDQIYDGLLARGVRPFVELGFMPSKLSADPSSLGIMWYHPNIAPPKDYAKWDLLIRTFATHLIDRYGIDEVAQWYFEVWNEPNLAVPGYPDAYFWTGSPKQETYFELYDHTARTLKSVDQRLRVGGPATAAAAWIPAFLAHVTATKAPIDFVSTHGYASDSVQDLFGTQEVVAMPDRVCRAVSKVRREIAASPQDHLPLIWSEWNVPGYPAPSTEHDTWFVGPALARTISQCDGKVDLLSWWVMDGVFEEGGVYQVPFDGGWGLITANQILKPAFYDFELLHRLGHERLDVPADNVLVTRREDGTWVVAAWNLVEWDQRERGSMQRLELHFTGLAAHAQVDIRRVDQWHGNPMPKYRALGSPPYPTMQQIQALNAYSALRAPERRSILNGHLRLRLPVDGLAVLEIRPSRQ